MDFDKNQPFSLYALKYYKLGLCIIPCNCKKPLISWKKYQEKRPSLATIYRWLEKYPNANIGIITGKISNLSVIDCDNLDLTIEDLQNEFGKTTFIVSTPSRGKHLYYSFDGESCKVNYQNRKIDIRANGGCIIAPYSFNADKKGFYEILQGNLNDLGKLPMIKNNLLKNEQQSDFCLSYKDSQNQLDLNIPEGQRNFVLFHSLKNIAHSHRSYESLLKGAYEINAFRFEKLLDEDEIKRTVKKVWNYKITNQLYSKKRSRKQEILDCVDNKNSFYLLEFLRSNHDGLRKYFYISQVPVAKQIGMTEKTLRKALDFLLKKNLLLRQKINNEKVSKSKKIKAFTYKYSFY